MCLVVFGCTNLLASLQAASCGPGAQGKLGILDLAELRKMPTLSCVMSAVRKLTLFIYVFGRQQADPQSQAAFGVPVAVLVSSSPHVLIVTVRLAPTGMVAC